MYLTERAEYCERLSPEDPEIESTIGAFERAVGKLSKMPVLWDMYCNFLVSWFRLTQSRRSFDRALCSLPLSQHDRIWSSYITFARDCNVPETAIRVYRRYLQYAPESREELVDYLLEGNHVDEAAKELVRLLEDADAGSSKGRSRLQLWHMLTDLIALHPDQVTSLRGRVEAIVRAGVSRFPDDNTGKLWSGLANHFVGLGMFDRARDVFEEGMGSCVRVRDFALLWDAYSELEEGLLQALIEADPDGADPQFDRQHARYESILERRPFLLNAVQIRATPNDVSLWHGRVKLYKEKKDWVNVARTFKDAIKTVDPLAAKGKVSSLHIAYAMFYEHNKQLADARKILTRAIEVGFSGVDELASIYCARVEMEIRADCSESALELLQQVCVVPPAHLRDTRGMQVQDRLYRSTKLWCLLADLEESVGSSDLVKAAYTAMMDLKIATPRVILNFADYLESHNFFEESFQAYERGVDLFDFPYSLELWIAYLVKFIGRYKGSKLERTRDIFEQVLEKVPSDSAKTFYIMYADFEERYGLARHAMAVYDRATRAVPVAEQYVMFLLYIARATDFFGVSRTREIYEKAIAVLPDKYLQDICLRYSDLEKRLGEVDRARAIFRHCANYCDPRNALAFYQTYHNFEVAYGNEDTFREMLRLKRSVAAKFDMRVNVLDAESIQRIQEQIKNESKKPEKLVAETQVVTVDEITYSAPPVANAQEIDLDDDDDDDDDDEEEEAGETKKRERVKDEDDNVHVVQQKVPAAVFGSIAPEQERLEAEKKRSRK